MLDFKIPELSDKEWVQKCLAHAESINCEYTFGNIYLWHTAYITKIAHYKDFLICRWGRNEDITYSLPIGTGEFKSAVEAIIEDARLLGIVPRIYGVTEKYKSMLIESFPDEFSFIYDDGNNDYVYKVQDLALLSGKRYHSKRNHITNFKKNNPDWCFEELSNENIDECIKLHTKWIENRYDNDSDADSDYSLEFESVLTGFENYDEIGFFGGLIRVASEPICYTFGEAVNDKCFVTHFEKAPAEMQGAYAIINQEFSKRLAQRGFELVNREEDLGLDGLRKAKRSYHPLIWLKKELAVYNG